MISVCMATYKGEKYIEEQLQSILNQTKKPDEVIICDDNSPDGTANLISNFIRKHGLQSKWKLIVNTTNQGYPANFYNCLERCTGDILFLSDQDDIWEPDKIKKMEQIISGTPQIQILSCNHGLIDTNGKEINGLMSPKQKNTMRVFPIEVSEILHEYRWPGMTMAIKGGFYRKISGEINKSQVPHDFILAILASSMKGFYFFDYVGTYHRRHDSNTAREEHRISRLLNLKRKIDEVTHYFEMLDTILESTITMPEQVRADILTKKDLARMRLYMLRNREFKSLIRLYLGSQGNFRLKSLVCDAWLLCFGKYKQLDING